MLDAYQLLRIFISSPGDVQEERRIAETVIGDVNVSCRDTLGIQADAHTWKRLPPLTPRMSESTIQGIINEEVRTCNVFVLILYKRYGTAEPGHTKSNTEREIDLVLKMISEGRNIMLLSYFRDLPANEDRGVQEEKVRQLRSDLAARGVLFRDYRTPDEFKDRFTHDLYHTILKFRASTKKQRALREFWELGVPEGAVHPRLAIVYPPLDRYYMRQESPDQIWLKRLVPHIVFEDFKALQKIEKTLRLIGFRDFDTYNVAAAPPDLDDMNRLWLCLPRNIRAQHQLELYRNRALFKVTPRQLEREACILWRRALDQSFVPIQSPLAKYLELQRCANPGGDWQIRHGRIIAKDFAVLARFSDRRDRLPVDDVTLKDFFLAGIRGLGTWGAGWFIDRRYNALKKCLDEQGSEVQVLLEVTYRDEQIFDVRIVSDEPESYFREENNIRTIRNRIRAEQG